jgi:hypothetical protein
VAYHEAGHVVVAAKNGLKIKIRSGMRIDDQGRGFADIILRPPGMPDDYPLSREDSIIVLHAGVIAEQRFDPESEGLSSSCDSAWISELLKEMNPSPDPTESKIASGALIEKSWCAIESLAKELLRKELRVRPSGEPSHWSESSVDRCLYGRDVESLLAPFGIAVKLSGPELAD